MVQFLVDFILWSPILSTLITSLVLTTILTFAYKKLSNYKRIKELNGRQKELRQELKENKENPAKLEEINKEMMKLSMESMKLSMKPMLITFIPLLVIFSLLRGAFEEAGVNLIINWGTSLPILGSGLSWFWAYVIVSFAFSLYLRKLFKMT
ncbi:MAG: EMC3/TMCO1 family protein [archaeon]